MDLPPGCSPGVSAHLYVGEVMVEADEGVAGEAEGEPGSAKEEGGPDVAAMASSGVGLRE